MVRQNLRPEQQTNLEQRRRRPCGLCFRGRLGALFRHVACHVEQTRFCRRHWVLYRPRSPLPPPLARSLARVPAARAGRSGGAHSVRPGIYCYPSVPRLCCEFQATALCTHRISAPVPFLAAACSLPRLRSCLWCWCWCWYSGTSRPDVLLSRGWVSSSIHGTPRRSCRWTSSARDLTAARS